MHQRVAITSSIRKFYYVPTRKALKWWSPFWMKPMTWLYNYLHQYCQPLHDRERAYYKELVIDYFTIRDKIREIMRDVGKHERLFPAFLFIGYDHFQELLGTKDIDHAMSFQITNDGWHMLYGMRLVIVPWIKGCFCMPQMEGWEPKKIPSKGVPTPPIHKYELRLVIDNTEGD